jgi:hypothetical protein
MGPVTEVAPLPERFVIRRWVDPMVEGFGFPVNSIYIEAVLLPILGPSACRCLRRLSACVAADEKGVEVDPRRLAKDLGLGDGLGRSAAATRTVRRLCQFDMARWSGGELWVRTSVAPVPERQLGRLSPEIVRLHRSMVARSPSWLQERAPQAAGPAMAAEPARPGVAL